MKRFFSDPIGRLRLAGFLEGTSLLVLVLIAVPLKHFSGNPFLVKTVGPIHGALFIFFVFQTISVATEYRWSFQTTTWKVLLACLVPFGTFYIDKTILRTMFKNGEKNS
jgi:integral membrane protein